MVGRLLGGEGSTDHEEAQVATAIARRHLRLLPPTAVLSTLMFLAVFRESSAVFVFGVWSMAAGYGTMLRRSVEANEAHLQSSPPASSAGERPQRSPGS